jgi:hypothetical protein
MLTRAHAPFRIGIEGAVLIEDTLYVALLLLCALPFSATGARMKGFRLSSTIDTSRLSQLGCTGRCCKISLTALASFLIVTGIAICAGAGYANQNSDVLAAIGTSFANLVLAFGVILMFVGSIGLGGAVRESRALLSLVSRTEQNLRTSSGSSDTW